MNQEEAKQLVAELINSTVIANHNLAEQKMERAREIMKRYNFWHEKEWFDKWIYTWRVIQGG